MACALYVHVSEAHIALLSAWSRMWPYTRPDRLLVCHLRDRVVYLRRRPWRFADDRFRRGHLPACLRSLRQVQ
ncbi:MAG: hypothetical protein O3A51_00390, partial [Verrucomicrobia bacterium]|nr:hypothetical protein [Verrucomicrobiota bacterium]